MLPQVGRYGAVPLWQSFAFEKVKLTEFVGRRAEVDINYVSEAGSVPGNGTKLRLSCPVPGELLIRDTIPGNSRFC